MIHRRAERAAWVATNTSSKTVRPRHPIARKTLTICPGPASFRTTAMIAALIRAGQKTRRREADGPGVLTGVKDVVSGYAGGKEQNPTYEQITSKATGHAEVIKIDFDPAVVSQEKVLDYFWHVHNPTQVGGQGNDHGPQYRSIILYASPEQKTAAEKSRAAAAKTFRDPITTEIVPLEKFWVAEKYHQDYFRRNPNAGYCSYVIAPKIKKLEKQLAAERK
jgi:peptide-methionine (S)-S-oxide reductase